MDNRRQIHSSLLSTFFHFATPIFMCSEKIDRTVVISEASCKGARFFWGGRAGGHDGSAEVARLVCNSNAFPCYSSEWIGWALCM